MSCGIYGNVSMNNFYVPWAAEKMYYVYWTICVELGGSQGLVSSGTPAVRA